MIESKKPAHDLESDGLLTTEETRRLAKCSESWVLAQVAAGRFPQPVRLGRRFTRWRAGDVREWLVDPAAWIESHKVAA